MQKRKPITPKERQRAARLRAIWETKKRETGWTQDVLADKLGYAGPSIVSQYLNGYVPCNMEAALKFSSALKCSITDIEPEWAGLTAMTGRPAYYAESRSYPVISWVQAGMWQEIVDTFEPGDAEEWMPLPGRFGPKTFLLKVQGDSMVAPTGESYPEGCYIIVDPERPASNGDLVVAKTGEMATFKKLVLDGDQRYLKPLNPQYQALPVSDDLTISGVVRGSIFLK